MEPLHVPLDRFPSKGRHPQFDQLVFLDERQKDGCARLSYGV